MQAESEGRLSVERSGSSFDTSEAPDWASWFCQRMHGIPYPITWYTL